MKKESGVAAFVEKCPRTSTANLYPACPTAGSGSASNKAGKGDRNEAGVVKDP